MTTTTTTTMTTTTMTMMMMMRIHLPLSFCYLDDAAVVDNVFDSIVTGVRTGNVVGDRLGQRRLADERVVDQLAALMWTVAVGHLVVSHEFSLFHQHALVISFRIADRHVTYT